MLVVGMKFLTLWMANQTVNGADKGMTLNHNYIGYLLSSKRLCMIAHDLALKLSK